MKKLFFVLVALLCSSGLFAQQPVQGQLYKGTIDGKMAVTMYVKLLENNCGGDPAYMGMYRYNGKSNWLQLNIDYNEKDSYIFLEHGFTGLMMMKKDKDGFKGTWISPDGSRQLKAVFKKAALTPAETEQYEQTLEKTNYENNDC